VRVLDFDPSQDRLDLNHLPMLRGTDQLRITATSDGARIVFGELSILITSDNGAPLNARDLFPNNGKSLGTADRAIVLNGPYDPDMVPDDTGAGAARYDVGEAPAGGWGGGSGGSGSASGSGSGSAGGPGAGVPVEAVQAAVVEAETEDQVVVQVPMADPMPCWGSQ